MSAAANKRWIGVRSGINAKGKKPKKTGKRYGAKK